MSIVCRSANSNYRPPPSFRRCPHTSAEPSAHYCSASSVPPATTEQNDTLKGKPAEELYDGARATPSTDGGTSLRGGVNVSLECFKFSALSIALPHASDRSPSAAHRVKKGRALCSRCARGCPMAMGGHYASPEELGVDCFQLLDAEHLDDYDALVHENYQAAYSEERAYLEAEAEAFLNARDEAEKSGCGLLRTITFKLIHPPEVPRVSPRAWRQCER